jgi:hypothetical protein
MSNGILSTFKKDGSDLSAYDGRTPPTIIFATQQSPMLAPYSIGGSENGAIAAYQTYNDGANNLIPRPTQLSMGAVTPPQYLNNLPQ